MTTEALLEFDALAHGVEAWPRERFVEEFEAASGEARWRLARLRWRWRLDEFATYAMGPLLARTGKVSPPGELDDVFFQVPPLRPEQRLGHPGLMRLVMTGRGIGKTTRQKIRAFHGLLYGARRVSLAIGQADSDATGWVATLRAWATDPSPELAAVFPELLAVGNEHHLQITTRFGCGHLLARGWRSSMRGINVHAGRPDVLDLDDVEHEDSSLSELARDGNQARLTSKVLPLVPIEGGAEVWWVQTPVHPDAVAVRAWRKHEALLGWETRRLPVIRRWPDRADLWEACRQIYFDVDTYGTLKDAHAAAKAWYQDPARKADMDAGAECLDPVRMGPYNCHAKRWDIGESAWATEYEMRAKAVGAGVLQPDAWPRFARRGPVYVYAGREIHLSQLELRAHYDPSDGGDDGALVVVGKLGGRLYAVVNHVWHHSRLSAQIAEIPEVLRECAQNGLTELQWEPTSGSASLVREQLEVALASAGLQIALVDRPSTEKKNGRIVGTLEPIGASGRLTLPESLPARLEAQAADFNPARTDNVDDWLDALQRAVEAHEGAPVEPSAREVDAFFSERSW